MKATITFKCKNNTVEASAMVKGKKVSHSAKLIEKHDKDYGVQHRNDKAKQVGCKVLEAIIWGNDL